MKKTFTLLLAILVILNVAFIFYQSLQNAEKSSAASGAVSDIVADVVVPDLSQRPETEQQSIMDKIREWTRTMAHAIEFASLGMLFLTFVLVLGYAEKIPLPYKLCSALLFSAFVALFDEIIQIFVDGRAFELKDIGIDTLGATCGILVCLGVFALYRILKKRKTQV